MKIVKTSEKINLKFNTAQLDRIILSLLNNGYNKKFAANVDHLFSLVDLDSFISDFEKEVRVYIIKKITQMIIESDLKEKSAILSFLDVDGKYYADAVEVLNALFDTATILSNIAQKHNIFIGSSLQLLESNTLPVNLTINDLSVSKTVKEVLDTLGLIKQIHRDNLEDYEYSLNEVDTEYFDLKKYDDPDVRYYACVVDKNRAGAKPTVLFELNLAYNHWEEKGYLRLKDEFNDLIG